MNFYLIIIKRVLRIQRSNSWVLFHISAKLESYSLLLAYNSKPIVITKHIVTHLFSHIENPRLSKIPFYTKFYLFFFYIYIYIPFEFMSPMKQYHSLSLKATLALFHTMLTWWTRIFILERKARSKRIRGGRQEKRRKTTGLDSRHLLHLTPVASSQTGLFCWDTWSSATSLLIPICTGVQQEFTVPVLYQPSLIPLGKQGLSE